MSLRTLAASTIIIIIIIIQTFVRRIVSIRAESEAPAVARWTGEPDSDWGVLGAVPSAAV